jgi:hypothetical protein
MEHTKVIFRKFDNGEVIAIFPEDVGSMNQFTCQSYLHVGQHGSCDDVLIDELEPASLEEYINLYTELESIGYNLVVCKEYTQAMYQNRIQKFIEWMKE